MSKITNIPSEIRNFFSEKRRSIVMDTFTRLLESLNLDNRSLGGLKRENCQLTNLQVFQILLLLPFFAIKGFSHYDGSALCRMFGGKKDVLYSYLSQDNVNWRNVVYRITNWLLTKVTVRQDGRDREITLTADDESILDAALRQGADLPYACKGGVCATCKCKVLRGKVDMATNYSLEPDELAAGYVLSCQSLPLTADVIVDFDAKGMA